MKQREITPCGACGRKVAEGNVITWYRVAVEQLVADLGAIRRQAGLEMQIGRLAAFMGPDEDIATSVWKTTTLICLKCATHLPLLALAEAVHARAEKAAAAEPEGGNS